MANYIDGYLNVLPLSQKEKIKEIIQNNQDLFTTKNVTEDQFKALLSKIIEVHQQLTTKLYQIEHLDPELYNQYLGNTYVDLSFLFLENQLIENALANYKSIFDAILNDLTTSLQQLQEKVNQLKLSNNGENGLIVKQYTFTDQSQMETDQDKYDHLFKDRDGSDCSLAVIQRTHDRYYVALNQNNIADCLHDSLGQVTANITIADRRGTPTQMAEAMSLMNAESSEQDLLAKQAALTNNTIQDVKRAIDGSTDTYWGEVVNTTEPINLAIQK